MSDEHVEQLLRWADEVSPERLDTRSRDRGGWPPQPRRPPWRRSSTVPAEPTCNGESDDELVANVEAHVQEEHPDQVGTMSREQILEMAHEH